MRAVLVAACIVVTRLAPAAAQEVRGRVTATDTRQPMIGVFVMLRDSSGTRWGAALTDSAGNYRIRAGKAGRFEMVAERIGYESTTTAFFDLTPADIETRDVSLGVKPVILPQVTGGPGDRCGDTRENASRTAQVWDEARKALTVASWAAQEKLVKYEITRYSRALDRNGRRTVREYEEQSTQLKSGTPWIVPDPKDLVRNGFAQPGSGGMIFYHVPGAEVLLSSEFLQSHCFGLRNDSTRPNQIGLTFRPIRSTARADVRGTLWLERPTIVLQQIEYEYVAGRFERSPMQGGGAMDYIQLENGVWLATSWRIHLLMRPLTGIARDLRFLLQEGSEVQHVLTNDSVTLWKRTSQQRATNNRVDADSAMDGPGGAPRLPAYSPAATVIQACGYSLTDDRLVEAVIFVGDPQGVARPNVPIRLAWAEGAGRPSGQAAGETNHNGIFVACVVPSDREVALSVRVPGTEPREVTLRARRGVILTRSFLVK